MACMAAGGICLFQSTLSVRRATISIPLCSTFSKFQSTLSVRRATLFAILMIAASAISIHALREESDVFGLVDYVPP